MDQGYYIIFFALEHSTSTDNILTKNLKILDFIGLFIGPEQIVENSKSIIQFIYIGSSSLCLTDV